MSDSSGLDESELSEPVRKKIKKFRQKLKYFHFLKDKLISEREQDTNDNGELVYVEVDGRVFNCHRQILISNSEYFAALLRRDFVDTEQNVITLPPVFAKASIFSKIVQALYGEVLKIEARNVIPIFVASSYLRLTYFLNLCKQYIRNHMEVINAFDLIMLPELNFEPALHRFVKRFVCKNFARLQTFMTGIPLVLFEELFADPDLFVVNLEEVLKFGRDWIAYDLDRRRQYLKRVCSILKPFHIPSEQSLKLFSNLESRMQNKDDVEVALDTLLDIRINRHNREEFGLDVKNSLFFLQPIKNGEVHISTYKDNAWVQLNNLRLPTAINSIKDYEGAVTNRGLFYFSAELQPRDVIFRSWNSEKEEWVELMSPQTMPECLVSFNSTVYSYEDFFDDHQISYFEPVLNRWFKIPAVKYPYRKAGVVSSEYVLYKVGGILPQNTVQTTKSSIIEMYDSRCSSWSLITPSSVNEGISDGNIPYTKRVTYYENKLYLFNSSKFASFDIRNQKWLTGFTFVPNNSPKVPTVRSLTILNGSVCMIVTYDDRESCNCKVFMYDRSNYHSSKKILDAVCTVRPISVPYSL